MAQTLVNLDSLPAIANPGRIVILGSKWYPELVSSMSETCAGVL